ncbi:hypothetical protein LAZ67_2003735, partial [Cordylochernes scorpioides]
MQIDFNGENDVNCVRLTALDQVKKIGLSIRFRYSKSNSRIIILALLLISGIESNPGPKVTRQTTLETPMEKDLKELIAALSSKMDDWGSKLESRLSGIELGMQKFDTRVQQLESSLESTASAVEVNVKKIRELESRVSFMEMKNREKNLIFYGMEGNGSENPDESRAKIKSLIKDKMQISDEIVISRCRRLSKKDKAPMLVEVPEYSERIKIFKNSFKLRDLKIFVSKDYSPSTREQRRLLIPKWKEFLNKGITAKLRDDKLIVNGTVYRVLNGKITTKEESNSITIANGRTKGDTNGSFTFISERGSSVLDYFMYTHGLTQSISDMWIEELSYSDHLPTVLQINTGYEAIKSSYNNEILTRKFIWTKENVEMLKHNLSDIEDGNETDINTKTVNFTKQIYTAMESADIIKFAKRRHQLSKPWYDKDCYIMKKTTKVSLQRCRNSNNTHDRQKYIEDRREYLKLLQRKRDEFNKDKNEMIKNAKDPKSFWNAIAAFRKKPIIQGEIDIKEWFLFYKNLLNKENNEATFTLNQMIGWKDPDLDAEITLEEIHDVVKKLANGKAVGLDGIPNELLKNLPTPTLTKLKNLFNKIMSTEKYPQLWTNSIVHPIYKSGDKNNPTNYRGIALCSNISKLFTTILRNRLNNWIEKREIILENQAGFRKNRSCTDHILLLNSLIQLSLRRKRGKLYVFFVDLTKAFDTVPHDLLWQKLHKMGISNKFVMLIKNFYQEAKITIRWKGQYSSNVKINSGVLQGESLSPLLFILYMADLIELYNNSALTGFHLPDFGVLHLLMYADDIAIIGESKINLQTKINLLKSYLDNNKLVLNENKSKVMVFRNGGRPARHENWYWGDIPLTVASNIMYLGFPFTTTNNSKKGVTINKQAYKEILVRLRDVIRRKRNQLFKSKQWKLLHDNASAHRAIIVQDYLTKHSVFVLPHPPYSPDIAPIIKSNSEIIAYADDLTVICWGNNLTELRNTTGKVMGRILDWCGNNKLTVSEEKTKILYLFNSKIAAKIPNTITVNRVEKLKIMGITFKNHRNKNKLDFVPHIDEIITKTNRASGYLIGLTGKAWGLDSKRRIELYKTLFRSSLTYGSTIWYNFIPKKVKDKLNSLQYKILKHSTQVYNSTSSNCTHIVARTPKLTDFIETNLLKMNIGYKKSDPTKRKMISNFINQKFEEYYGGANDNFKGFFDTSRIPNYVQPNFYNVQFFTGHGDFNTYLFRIGKIGSPACTCGNEQQTPEHLLIDCPLTSDLREENQLYLTNTKQAACNKDQYIKFKRFCR